MPGRWGREGPPRGRKRTSPPAVAGTDLTPAPLPPGMGRYRAAVGGCGADEQSIGHASECRRFLNSAEPMSTYRPGMPQSAARFQFRGPRLWHGDGAQTRARPPLREGRSNRPTIPQFAAGFRFGGYHCRPPSPARSGVGEWNGCLPTGRAYLSLPQGFTDLTPRPLLQG